ncbi:DUF6597 domain-containing transcriptional factor [Bacteroides sp.]
MLYPSPLLSQYIKYDWVLKTDEVEPVVIQTIPSGCVHLVFHRGENLNIQSKGLQPSSLNIPTGFSDYIKANIRSHFHNQLMWDSYVSRVK